MNIRDQILLQLAIQGRTKYWLANQVRSGHPTTVYAYLRGRNDCSSTLVGEMLEALDLDITRRTSLPPD